MTPQLKALQNESEINQSSSSDGIISFLHLIQDLKVHMDSVLYHTNPVDKQKNGMVKYGNIYG